MKVKDVMHTGLTWVSPDAKLADVARKMRDEDVGSIPVGKNDPLVGMVSLMGMVTDRDIACRGLAKGRDISHLTARDVMSKPILYCRADDDVQSAVQIMETSKIRRLPVINEDKRMVGMLSLGDVSQKVSLALAGEVIQAVCGHHP
jgi:CBS domain-containing protein